MLRLVVLSLLCSRSLSGDSASDWKSVQTYSIERNQSITISFCPTATSASTLFVILPVASLHPQDVQKATSEATQIRTTFSSDLVQHIEIVENSTIYSSKSVNEGKGSRAILYQIAFNHSRCMDASSKLSQPGIYVIFAQDRDIRMKLTTGTGAVLKRTACFAGCDPVSSTETETGEVHSARWYHPVLASLVISLTSVAGVFVLILYRGKMDNLLDLMISFAAGCLMGVIVFHLYNEATSYLEDTGEWVVGVCVLGGIAFSIILEQGTHIVLAQLGVNNCGHDHKHTAHDHPHVHTLSPMDSSNSIFIASQRRNDVDERSKVSSTQAQDANYMMGVTCRSSGINTGSLANEKLVSTSLRLVDPIAWITAIGDCFHALTDGIVLAVGFRSCSVTVGWTIALSIVLHEIPHRVGNYFIFLKAGMNKTQALVVNMCASLASLLGVLILFATGSVSDHTLGVLLAVGSGALLFIALSQLLPSMLAVHDPIAAAKQFLSFLIGCAVIGLSLLKETECE